MSKKIVLLLLSCAVLLTVLAGCTAKQEEESSQVSSVSSEPSAVSTETSAEMSSEETTAPKTEPTRILTISGPTGIGMANMMEQNQGAYEFTITGTPSDVMTAIVSGSADIAACPINLAAKIFKKTDGSVQMLAVNTLGVLYIVTNGKQLNSFSDLNGLEVVASGEGATPEYAMKYLCEAYGIQVNLRFVDEFSTAAAMVATGECSVALLAEPSVSVARMQNQELTVALDLTEVWRQAGQDGKIEAVELAQGCVIVRSEFAKAHPEAVQQFLADYQASVTYMSDASHLEDAAALCEQYKIVPKAAVAKMAIPHCNLVCMTNEEMKTIASSNLQVLYQYDPSSIGGSMPADAFYYAE